MSEYANNPVYNLMTNNEQTATGAN